MATTSIKDGYQGGSDNQLKVNSDGSINVNSSGGGGSSNVTIIQGGNTAIVNSDGELLVNTNTGFSNLSPGYPTQITVGTSSVILLPANPVRRYAHISNNSQEAIYIQYSSTAALNQGIKIGPGGFYTLEIDNLYRGVINAIGLMSGQMIDVCEGI